MNEATWLSLEPERGETLRGALRRTIRDAIVSGALRVGVRLPASRELAHQLGVSRGVVNDAYAQLAAEGFLEARERVGTIVAAVGSSGVQPRRRHAPASTSPRTLYDLTPTTPDVSLFPVAPWVAAYQDVARRTPAAAIDYGDPCGERSLREVLADHLGRTRGVVTDPERIIVVQGTAQGVDLLLRALKRRGATTFAVEDPSHTTQHERVRSHGLRLVGRPVDSEGVIVDDLHADAILLTPAHQFPTGGVLSGARRRQLLTWSRTHDAFLVEDDYDAEFRYDREPVRALQGLDPDRVVQLGTVSKTLAPALRLGWVVAPDELVDDLQREKRLVDDFSPALDQRALARLIASGDYSRHLRRARVTYRRRRDALLGALNRFLPEFAVEGVAAGVHFLLHLPNGTDDAAIADAARATGIVVPALSRFQIEPNTEAGLVVGYGRLREAAVVPATRALAQLVRREL